MSKKFRSEEYEPDMIVPDVPEEIVKEAPQADEPKPGPVRAPKATDREAYIARKLMVINEWPDGAKKRAAVERLLRRKEV